MVKQVENQRECARVDDTLFVQFGVLGSEARAYAVNATVQTDLSELLSTWRHVQAVTEFAPTKKRDTVVEQLLLRIDWMLNEVLQAMARMTQGQLEIPRPISVNIGVKGFRFESTTEVSVGDTLSLFLVLPIFNPIKCFASVTWIRQEDKGDQVVYYIGAYFLDITDQDKERIAQYVKHREAESLQERSEWRELYKKRIARVMDKKADD